MCTKMTFGSWRATLLVREETQLNSTSDDRRTICQCSTRTKSLFLFCLYWKSKTACSTWACRSFIADMPELWKWRVLGLHFGDFCSIWLKLSLLRDLGQVMSSSAFASYLCLCCCRWARRVHLLPFRNMLPGEAKIQLTRKKCSAQ